MGARVALRSATTVPATLGSLRGGTRWRSVEEDPVHPLTCQASAFLVPCSTIIVRPYNEGFLEWSYVETYHLDDQVLYFSDVRSSCLGYDGV